MNPSFRAFRVHQDESGFRSGVEQLDLSVLPDADVTVNVHYSSVNYKDGLASIPEGKIVKTYPFIPGIDLAGEVTASRDPRWKPGDQVLCTGYGLGVTHAGGFAEVARVPGDWLVPLPEGLMSREAMAIGTAGFTAALSVRRLLDNGLATGQGPVLVLGATGGVGSMAVAILSRLGFAVTAVTGKPQARERLMAFGASEVLSREEAASGAKGALGKERWAAIVDPVGGAMTADLLKSVRYGGSIALSGLTGGSGIETNVYPFIYAASICWGSIPSIVRSRCAVSFGSFWPERGSRSQYCAWASPGIRWRNCRRHFVPYWPGKPLGVRSFP